MSSLDHSQALVAVGPGVFRAAVAKTIFSRAKGLSGQRSMAEDEAMLFTFPLPMRYSFWMKGMRFPLDIIWIRNGMVVDISENAPAPKPGTSFVDLLSGFKFRPRVAADAVLEVNAGMTRRLGIRMGDKVEVMPPAAKLVE